MRRKKGQSSHLAHICSLVLLTIACCAAIQAQNIFGRISGTVTDPAGAVVPNITITITNEATKISRTTTTGSDGFYVADSLPVGSYSVTAEQTGFKKTITPGVVVVAGAHVTANVNLEVGSPAETVQVQAGAEVINTTSGELARHIDSEQVQKAALNQRNYAQLATLIPGAALTVFDQTTLTTGMSTTAASINGNRADGNLFTVDGGFNLDGGSNATQLNNIGLDFINEVAVQTSNYSAEYGRNNGASVNVVTRSGGDKFHGGLFEYVRNDRFDAVNVASKLNATPTSPVVKPTLRFNDFGWNVGGPILKHKLFFFAGEEWKRIRQSATPQNMTIPTSAELAGNFSALLGLSTPVVLVTPPNAPAGCTIVGNIMSPQCISADGKAIASVYAHMAALASSFSNAATANNATFQPNNPQNWREDIVRIDYQLGASHSIYGRYIHDSLNLIDAFGTFTPGGLPTTPTNRIRPGYSYQVGDVWTINSHLINEAKFNVSLNKQASLPPATQGSASTYNFQFTPPFGLVGTFPRGNPPRHLFERDCRRLRHRRPAQFAGPYFSLIAPTTDLSVSDNLTWQKGNHSLKFGGTYAHNSKLQNSRPDSYNGAITFTANGNPNTTKDPFADALMGNSCEFQTAVG